MISLKVADVTLAAVSAFEKLMVLRAWTARRLVN
jgi:hypothetical protein